MMKKNSLRLFGFFFAALIHCALADGGGLIQLGEPLPAIRFAGDQNGAVQLVGGEIQYAPWSTEDLRGKPRIVYHLAARAGIEKVHGSLFERLSDLQIDPKKFVTLTLLNGDDVTLGVSGIARREFEKNKKKHPTGEFVFDADSKAQRAWQLHRKGSAVILVDEDGVVRFFKDGKLSDEETDRLIEQVKVQSGYKH